MTGPISVPVAIVLGLLSSFIQSLGLTVQRKSHLQNASLPDWKRRSEWKRPLWLMGFAIFIVANIGGTVFQIGALPIVMLAPLGAVSLLYNALLARFILDDFFSRYMVLGTLLIAVGAVLIGYFGVVQEPNHSLDDLLALYARPPFIAFASIFALAFVGILAVAHLAEWQLNIRLFRPSISYKKTKPSKRRKPKRRWSAPSLAPLMEVSESSSGIATPVLAVADEAARRGIPVDRVLPKGNGSTSLPKNALLAQRQKSYGSFPRPDKVPLSLTSSNSSDSLVSLAEGEEGSTSVAVAAAALHDPAVRKTCLGLAIAYGGASGTLSGACLLLAKSGVELLVLTIGGDNQFDRWQSWFLVILMLAIALLQLWYLNKSLRLADPTLVCPLAFCFYNTSSIMLGLVYFDQLGSLSGLSLCLVIAGIVVLLAGVWTVSLHGSNPLEDNVKEEEQNLLNSVDEALLLSQEEEGSMTCVSPTEIDNPTEVNASLANAGGIGGPHLPPPAPSSKNNLDSTASTSSIGSPKSPLSSLPMSPISTSMKGGRRSRARSGSGSLIAGLGMHVPGLPVQNVRFEAYSAASSTDVETSIPTSPTSVKPGHQRSGSEGSTILSPLQLQRQRPLLESLLERGLSIGISPSSPGFHLRQSFEEEASAALQNAQRESALRQLPRRALSEADVESVVAQMPSLNNGQAHLYEDEGEETAAEEEEAGSAWNRVIPTLDYNTLSDRMARIANKPRGWFGSLFVSNNGVETDNGNSA